MPATVVIAYGSPDNSRIEHELLRSIDAEIIRVDGLDTPEARDVIGAADALMVTTHQVSADLIAAMPRCRVISRAGTGLDAIDIPAVMPFWEAVLGYRRTGGVLIDPHLEGPVFWFQQMDAPRPQRNRIHIDLYLPEDRATARVEAGLAAGGRVVNDANVPEWWTLADPEGNEVDVAPWPDMG